MPEYNPLKVGKIKQIELILTYPKSSKVTRLKSYISPVMGKLKIKFGQQASLIQRAPLCTPPQEVVMPLTHNQMTLTNLFISSYRGTVIKFGP